MTDAFGAPKPARAATECPPSESDGAGAARRLAILPPPHAPRDGRPVTNLGKVFGQFADLQQQIAEQVVALEDSVCSQRQDIAAAMAQLPELRERINWLIASFYEQSKKHESVRDRLGRRDTAIEGLMDTVRVMRDQQASWLTAFDDVIASLIRAKQALASHG
jgi:hypothetical protein